ncbi:MAG: NADAR family protein [Candidatus Vogelbacteria bacterium]|nr:NADAR family protein [Candidatus Vogelbacteria bacterium]
MYIVLWRDDLLKKEDNVVKNQNVFLFWDGILSQWHSSEFALDGLAFKWAEQWMMYKKAEIFGDTETMKKVLRAESPKECKQLGRQVCGFISSEWDKVSRDIVYEGNIAKFSQNVELKKQLLDTGDAMLVEASPYDKKWGIGLAASDPRAKDPSRWLGTNWLGEVLMRVRTELRRRQESAVDQIHKKKGRKK